jgi:hypothetical protein
MEYYLAMEDWAERVRDFKDTEKTHDIEPRRSEQLALKMLDFIRYTRIRQWPLFVQKRGEEYERMVEGLVESGFNPEAIQRFVEQEERWTATLEMGER